MQEGKWYYSPSIGKDYVAWSLSTQGSEGEECGEVFIYSKATGEISSLQSTKNLIPPRVYGDYLILREKPQGKNFIEQDNGYLGASLWCYDLKKGEWRFSLTNQLKPYQDKEIATLHVPKASYQDYFVYDTEPETDPLVLIDMKKPCYYTLPNEPNIGKAYHFLKFSEGYLYLALEDKVYRVKIKN